MNIDHEVAKLCKWKLKGDSDLALAVSGYACPDSWVVNPTGELASLNSVPAFSSDLNAMAEAENHLSENEYWIYVEILSNTTKYYHNKWMSDRVSCDAKQKALAFLRAKGKI